MQRKRVEKRERKTASADRQTPAGAASPWPFLLASVALCILTLLAYANSLDNGFVWDDHEQIVMNPYIKPGAPLTPLFTADVRFAHQGPSVQTRVYRPLQLLTYRTIADWFGSDAVAFHAVSLGFAIAGSLAAFWTFWLLTRSLGVSFTAAALFAVHPVHTEAVDWIAALPDLGMGLFVLLSFASFLHWQRALPNRTTRWLFSSLSLLAFAVALLWKETAVVLPLLLIAYTALIAAPGDRGNVRERALRAWWLSSLYWLVLAAYATLRFAVLDSLTAGARTWDLNAAQTLRSALYLAMLYCGKLLLPIGLNAYHVFHPLQAIVTTLASLLFALGVVTCIVVLARRAPLAAFASIWIFLALLPAMNLSGLGRNPFAERYLYLPSAGFCLLASLAAAWLLQRSPLRTRKPIGVAMLVLALAAYTTETVARNPVWKDDNTLFAETLKLSPDAAFVRNMVAAGQSADMAETNYRQALALSQQASPPDRIDAMAAYKGLASLYADSGEFDRALQTLSEARRIDPDDPDMAGEQGIILAQTGRGGEAMTLLNQALAEQPDNENVLSALGLIARDERHDLAASAAFFERALAAHPQQDEFSASQHNNLAGVYADQENFAGAISELKQAIAIVPGNPEFHDNLASALAASGRFDQSLAEAQTALQLAPNDTNAHDILQRLSQQNSR